MLQLFTHRRDSGSLIAHPRGWWVSTGNHSRRAIGSPQRRDPSMETQSALKLEVAALSDVGCKRSNNEDSFGYDLSTQIFAVCDGMGGMAAGEVASSTAVAELVRSFNERPSEMQAEKRLYQAILHANSAVLVCAEQ